MDSVKPLLRSLGSLLIGCGLRLQLSDPIFGRVQVMQKFLSHIQRASAIFFSNASCTIKQLQNRLSRLVELISVITNAYGNRRKWNYRQLVAATGLSRHSWPP